MRYTVTLLALLGTLALLAQGTGALPASGDPSEHIRAPEVQRVLATYDELMDAYEQSTASAEAVSPRVRELQQRIAAEVAVAQAGLTELLVVGDADEARAAAFSLGYAPDAGRAVRVLAQALEHPRADLAHGGELVSNVCVALETIARRRRDVDIPLPPFVRTAGAERWSDQQNAARVLEVLAEQGRLKEPTEELYGALIRMLASQRSRVSGPARRLLPRLTGQTLGNDPMPWAEWFSDRYGRTLDVRRGVYELVQIVRPELRDGKVLFLVENETYHSRAELLKRLKEDAQAAQHQERRFALVLQVPEEGFPVEHLQPLQISVFAVLPGVEIATSPASDEFVPFETALERLHRLTGRVAPAPATMSGRS